MRPPRHLVINQKKWRVVLKPIGRRGFKGRCLYQLREIQIDSEMPPAERAETLLHEVMHACLLELWPSKTEERMIQRLAPRLLKVLISGLFHVD